MQERSVNGWRGQEPGEVEQEPVTPRAELHRLVDEMSDEAVERLLAVLHAWRHRASPLLSVCTGLLLMTTC